MVKFWKVLKKLLSDLVMLELEFVVFEEVVLLVWLIVWLRLVWVF